MDDRRIFGDEGEQLAADFLRAKGYQIHESQYRTRFGEIDLICLDGDEIVFVEVKARHSAEYGFPEEAITPQKVRHITRTAEHFLSEHHVDDRPWRVDVVAIEYDREPPRITHIDAIDMPDRF